MTISNLATYDTGDLSVQGLLRVLSTEASSIVTVAKTDGIGIVPEPGSGRVHSERLSRNTNHDVHGVNKSILQCSSARCGEVI